MVSSNLSEKIYRFEHDGVFDKKDAGDLLDFYKSARRGLVSDLANCLQEYTSAMTMLEAYIHKYGAIDLR